MRKSLQFLGVFSFLLFWGITAQAEIIFKEVASEEDWQTALKEAKAAKKLIFVDVYTDWCGYCKKMDKEVYTNESVARYFNDHYVNVKVDGENAFGEPFVQRYSIEGFPSYVVLDGNEQQAGMFSGYMESPDFLAAMQEIETNYSGFIELDKKYKQKSTLPKAEMAKYILALGKMNSPELPNLTDKYLTSLTDAEMFSAEHFPTVSTLITDYQSAQFKKLSANRAAIEAANGPEVWTQLCSKLYEKAMITAIQEEDDDVAQAVNQDLLPYFVPAEELEAAKLSTYKMFYGYIGSAVGYREAVNKYASAQSVDHEFYYQEAQTIIEYFGQADAMRQLGLDYLDKSLGMKKTFQALILKGYAVASQGEYAEAKKLVKEASEIAANEEETSLAAEIMGMIENAEKE